MSPLSPRGRRLGFGLGLNRPRLAIALQLLFSDKRFRMIRSAWHQVAFRRILLKRRPEFLFVCLLILYWCADESQPIVARTVLVGHDPMVRAG